MHLAVHVKDAAVGPSICGKAPVSHDRKRVTCKRCLRYSPRPLRRIKGGEWGGHYPGCAKHGCARTLCGVRNA